MKHLDATCDITNHSEACDHMKLSVVKIKFWKLQQEDIFSHIMQPTDKDIKLEVIAPANCEVLLKAYQLGT